MLFALLAAASFASCSDAGRMPTAGHPVTEHTEELGGGFRRVILAEFITGGFESVYHGEYLYYREHKLGDFVSSSISPNREFAAFVESDTQSPIRDDHFGFHVFLFRVTDQKIVQLTKELRYDWRGFDWDESAGYVILRHHDAPPERLSFPKT